MATDLVTCAAGDTKGLYPRAKAGQLPHLTGWNDPYEVPTHPEFIIETVERTVAEAAGPLCRQALTLSIGHRGRALHVL